MNRTNNSNLGSDKKNPSNTCKKCAWPVCHTYCPIKRETPNWVSYFERAKAAEKNKQAGIAKKNWHLSWKELALSSPFADITGRVCPAPCIAGCVYAHTGQERFNVCKAEQEISDQAWKHDWVSIQVPNKKINKSIAIVGSGPAGLTAAWRAIESGIGVVVFEKEKKLGGLLRYGIPTKKLPYEILDRNITLLKKAGVDFRTDTSPDISELKKQFDHVILASGKNTPRKLPTLKDNNPKIIQAIDLLRLQAKLELGEIKQLPINLQNKTIVLIGGGHTADDAVLTANQQGVKQVIMLVRKDRETYYDTREHPSSYRVGKIDLKDEKEFFTGGEMGDYERWYGKQIADLQEKDSRLLLKLNDSTNLSVDFVLLALGFEDENLSTEKNLTVIGDASRSADSNLSELVVQAIDDGEKVIQGLRKEWEIPSEKLVFLV